MKTITIDTKASFLFNNNTDVCVGTGRMGLALQKNYLEQLEMVQKAIGFKYIRGHGLFSDDMAFCQTYTDENGQKQYEYNYTYIDMVMDRYLELGIRPFLELGFMPEEMASGRQTVFYWKGNVTPPADYDQWAKMIKALLLHLMERYGREEVIQWPIEVWNEPNLKVFWKDGDMQEYFRLYQCSALAVKEVDSAFKVGGPAVCGVEDQLWIRSFLEFVRDNQVPLDFVSRHHYTIHFPENVGHYKYARLHDLHQSFEELETSRDIVDSFEEYKGMDIHITEFNTAYVPDAPLHDTNLNAAFLASMLARLGDKHASYSYWTFGDIFEEKGVPFSPFHGGFGMVANGCIPKPTFWTFVFFKQLQGQCIHKDENSVIVKTAGGSYRGLVWNADAAFSGERLEREIIIPEEEGSFCLIRKTVDEESCNPLKVWHDMGEPIHLMPHELDLLKEHAVPSVKSTTLESREGKLSCSFTVGANGIEYFELSKVEIRSDRGYSYQRVLQGE